MTKKVFILVIVLFTAVLATNWLLSNLQAAQAALLNTLVLYDGTLGGTPDTQNLEYAAANPLPPFSAQATQTYSPTLNATILDSTPEINDYAGYALTPTLAPVLSRSAGFQLNFTLRLAAESHTSQDRSGFNVTLLAEDVLGIELAFWEDEIWAQEDGAAEPPLFTHAEGTAFDTTAAFVDYELLVIEDIYQLSAGGVPILSGPLRDYTAWEPPLPGLPDPYEQPNFVALSDNTTSAQAETWLAYVAVLTDTAPVLNIVPASQTISETAGTAVFDVQLSYTSTFTVTVDYATIDGSALAGQDYTAVSGTLTYPPLAVTQPVSIPIIDNDTTDPVRQFQLGLSDPSFARLGESLATVTVADDEGGLPLEHQVFLPLTLKP